MSRTDADVEGFINDLDTDDTELLIELIAGLDPLAQEDGKPKYTGDEITLIGRFQQFAVDYPTDQEDDDLEDENDENSEDIPGTGEETKEEYEARVQGEQNQVTADAAASEAPAEEGEQNPGYTTRC